MSMQELLQAFGMFKQSVQEAATTNAVNDASQAMQQIKTGITDQAQQRQALQGLSDQLALRLTGVGAPASTIQTAFQAIEPQKFGSVEQLALEANLSGDKHLQKTAKGMQQQAVQAKRAEELYKAQLQMQLEQYKTLGKIDVETAKAGLEKKNLKSEEVKIISEVTDPLEKLKVLEHTFNSLDTSTLPRTGFLRMDLGPQANAFKAANAEFFNAYKKLISGTAVSDQERPDLLAAIPNVEDSPWTYRAKVEQMKKNLTMIRNKKVLEFRAAGRDTSGFEQMYQQQEQQQQQAQARDMYLKQYAITGGGQ